MFGPCIHSYISSFECLHFFSPVPQRFTKSETGQKLLFEMRIAPLIHHKAADKHILHVRAHTHNTIIQSYCILGNTLTNRIKGAYQIIQK